MIEQGLGREKLGRLAPTLQALPTVIWHTPLEQYVSHTVAEIRQLKTHGEKRVRVVLEVFYIVHEMLAGAGSSQHLAVRIVPKFIQPIEDWIARTRENPAAVNDDEVREHLAVPLLNQIQVDAGNDDSRVERRPLGQSTARRKACGSKPRRWASLAARVYQLLEDCSRVMDVRWPEGQQLLAELEAKFQTEGDPAENLRLFQATRELFFPGKYKLSDEESRNVAGRRRG